MRIFITGASGYVGGELLFELKARGHEIWCTTRNKLPPPGVPANRHLTHDLRYPFPFAHNDFDLIIHAAGANDIQSKDFEQALGLTVLTARRCAEFAARQKFPRLLYISTFQVYGSIQGCIDEQTTCYPRNDYALTHLFAEQSIEQIGRVHDFHYVFARPANICGVPRAGLMQRWTLVPGCFCRDALERGRIQVHSDAVQQRDFLSLSEVSRQLADVVADFESYPNGPLNICSGVSISIADVASIAAERSAVVLGKPCDLQFLVPPDEWRAPGATLEISSLYLQRNPRFRQTRAQSIEQITNSVDLTFEYLRDTLNMEI